jgi:hypothetical protein
MRCDAKTRSGRQCFNRALNGSDFCAAHRDRLSVGAVVATGLGMVAGNVLLPGLGGLALGGISGRLVRSAIRKASVEKKRVFVSFDFDNDRALKAFFIGQSELPDSPFEIVDHSLREAAPERMWEEKACAAIRASDLVLVIVGRSTYRARGVLREVEMARACGTPVVQMIGYRSGSYTPVSGAGRLYAWNWENLKRLLA